MPIQAPSLDKRRYQDILNEALARIPVHNPEWTNFNPSDPGVTLIEVFSFLTENLLYVSNRVPDHNRLKFLELLGIPLQPASAAQGLVTFANDNGPLETITLNGGLEVRAGQIPFRTLSGLDILPVETRVYYKRTVQVPDQKFKDYYAQLYKSFVPNPPEVDNLDYYQTTAMPDPIPGSQGINLPDTIDGLWIALLLRANDKPITENTLDLVRKKIAGKTLNLGVVPVILDPIRTLGVVGKMTSGTQPRLQFFTPQGGSLPASRIPQYRPLVAVADQDVLSTPGVVQVTLPGVEDLSLWDDLDPLELGVDIFPPDLDDSNLNPRLITWLHITNPDGVQARLLWVGINAVNILQQAVVLGERLPTGTGEPDQAAALAHQSIVTGSVRLQVTAPSSQPEPWNVIDDLFTAGPEAPTQAPHQPPGTSTPQGQPDKVFQLDAEAGVLQFGDGTHGRRPPAGASLTVDYAYSQGKVGNVGPAAINNSPSLPAGLTVTNSLSTWGGADAETIPEGEKQVARYLQHRDRLVTVADFETVTYRTPGVEVGRVEVLPAYNPKLSTKIGDAPGAVTLMVIPRYDQLHPDYPEPNQVFLRAICDYLDPRRLVTTELFLHGPDYQDVWVSAGIQVMAGFSIAQVRQDVESALRQFLSPLPADPSGLPAPGVPLAPFASGPKGWPLGKSVIDLELQAVASRVAGVLAINKLQTAFGAKPNQATSPIPMVQLQLPRLAGISVVLGDALPIYQVAGPAAPSDTGTTPAPRINKNIPIPVIPEECR